MMKVYIAGSYTKHWARNPEECRLKFEAAKKKIEMLGYEAVSPLDLGLPDGTEWEEAEDVCLKALFGCRIIFMLSDWRESKGAKNEMHKWLETTPYNPVAFEEKGGYEYLKQGLEFFKNRYN